MKTKTKNKRDRKPNLFTLLIPYKGMIVMLVSFTIIGNGVNLVIPKIISYGIDSFTDSNYDLSNVLILFLMAAFAIFLFGFLQQIYQTKASEKVAYDIRESLFDKISRQSYLFVQQSNPSKLLTNLTSDIDAIKMFVANAVTSIISSLIIIIGTCILLLSINWKLALIVISIIPIISFAFYFVLKKVRVYFKQGREIIDRLNKTINESILGAAIIRVTNSQQIESLKFMQSNTRAKDIGIQILTMFATLIPIITFVANLALLVILGYGGHLVITDSLSMGDFAAFNSYVSILIFPIISIGFMSNAIARASASYERIENIIQAPEAKAEGDCHIPLQGDIKLNDIYKEYAGRPVLQDISVHIKKGTHTAILGPTAAGKTQLLYLLIGLIDASGGEVLYDDRSIVAYKKQNFHNQIGFVFQDSILFNLSIRDNIAFNNSVTEETLNKAVQTAELYDFIEQLPRKMDTMVSERGTSLSGGQKQRIMLARALALNPKILLLDDFTARVDRKTENKILDNIKKNYPNLTLVSVTQQINPIKHFEQIILLMAGEIVAKGNHKELLDTCPEYMQIYNSQQSTNHYEL